MIELRDIHGGVLFASKTAMNEREALLEAVQRQTQLPEINLSGRNLSGLDLTGLYAPGGNFQDAQMVRTNLEDAVMPGADLTGAQASNLHAPRADFTNCKMDFLQIAGHDTDLTEANISGSHGKAVQAAFANLRGLEAKHCNLPAFQGTNADISHSNWEHSELPGAQFFKADAKHAGLENVKTRSAGMDFDTSAETANFSHADLRFSSISGDWSNVNFYGAKCDGMKVTGPIKLEGANFEAATGIGPSHEVEAVLAHLQRRSAGPSQAQVRGPDRGPGQGT